MKYKKVPGTDISVSVVCQGTMRFAAKEAGNDDLSQSGERAMRRALERGVNFFHSSYQYKTRWLMDRILKDYVKRDELHHVIKVVVPDRGDDRVFSSDKFRLQVEEALRELHTERISIVQWLFLDTDAKADEEAFLPVLPSVIEQAKRIFDRLKSEGKVSHLYAMARTPMLLDAMLNSGSFEGAVERYNLLNMRMAEKFDGMKEKSLGLIPIEPLYAGLLTDRRRKKESLPESDRFRDKKYEDDYAKLDRLIGAFKDEIGSSLTGFALRFHFATPVIPSVAVSLNTEQQTDEICDAVDMPLPDESMLEKAIEIWRDG